MGRWTRQEIEEAFENYQRLALQAGTSGDWRPWADQFTEDATYVEHGYGRMCGREAIFKWIDTVMHKFPASEMKYFPIEWYVIDEEKGWVCCYVWNRMSDPGDGSLYQEANMTLLKYAGNKQWSSEEDAYNPVNFAAMIRGWLAARERCSKEEDPVALRHGRGPRGF
jgi:SnoaL-like domain